MRPTAPPITERHCDVCGAPLAGHRADAEVCGSACRRERSRLRALRAGKGDPPYAALDQYAARRQRRAKAAEAA